MNSVKPNFYVSPMRGDKAAAANMTPRSKSLFAFVGESTHAYQSPAKDLSFINRRVALSASHAAPEAAHSNSGSAAAAVASAVGAVAAVAAAVGGGVASAVAAVAAAVEAAEAAVVSGRVAGRVAGAAGGGSGGAGEVHPRPPDDTNGGSDGSDQRPSKARRSNSKSRLGEGPRRDHNV
jgi:hypothetical protein